MYSEQEHDSHDEIKLFTHRQVVCAMGAMWHLYWYQDYPASIPAVCSFKVQTPQQLDFIVKSGKISDLQVYYNKPRGALPLTMCHNIVTLGAGWGWVGYWGAGGGWADW
jgi:hypothetical protein